MAQLQIGHLRESICTDEFESMELVNRSLPSVPAREYHPYAVDESGIVKLMPFGQAEGYSYVISGMHHNEDGMPNISPENTSACVNRINDKIEKHKEEIWLWDERNTQDAEVLIVACGNISRSAIEAADMLRRSGIKAGVFRPISIWPFPEEPLRRAAEGVGTIIVPELNRGQLIHIVRELVGSDVNVCPLQQNNGLVIMPEQIETFVKEVMK